MPKTVSVVIPTLNGGPLFREVLAALRAQGYPLPLEIIVMDSGSTDSTLADAAAAGAQIHAVPSGTFNHGLTRNAGIEHSTGEIIVLLTQDAVPADTQLIARLVDAYDDPAAGGAYARQIPRPEHDCLVQRGINNHLIGKLEPKITALEDAAALEALPPMQRYILCNFDNVCSSVRRTAWQQVPFTQNDFAEDLDWGKRALLAGWKIAYVPAAAVIHSHDRPIRYEFKRTYMCHRKLYELFGVATIPARKYMLRCMTTAILQDWAYVLRHGQSAGEKISLMAKVPFLAYASVLAQYRGARDERTGRGRKQEGV